MNKTTALNTPTDDTAAYEADINHTLAEMRRIQQQMADDRQEIESLQAETRAILTDIMHTLRTA